MYGIFRESLVIFKNYGGNGYLLYLFVAALIYLLIAEKDMRKKLLVAIVPAIILVGFFVPFTRIAYVAVIPDGGDTYYRLLWLLPMGVCIAYAGCKLFAEHKRIGVIVISVLIIFCGSLVYKNQYVSRAENLYHIPQVVIDICDKIKPEEGEPRVRGVFPDELIHFVRQYDTDILMPYGRDTLHHEYYNAVREAYHKPEVINAKELLAATRETKCRYIIMIEGRAIDTDLEDMGLILLDNIGGYNIYEDPKMAN
ncbi:MAG: hypothetical protein E7302_11940 [Butyrivibrio sp.]|nr:hypothetical protein [Butyrivibrio sp.]